MGIYNKLNPRLMDF